LTTTRLHWKGSLRTRMKWTTLGSSITATPYSRTAARS